MTTRIDMSKIALWRKEFGGAYQVPAEIEAAVSAGLLVDVSWHNDVCPSFGKVDENGDITIRLWVEHPDPDMREMQSPERFMVSIGSDGCEDSGSGLVEEFQSDDVNVALAKVKELLERKVVTRK